MDQNQQEPEINSPALAKEEEKKVNHPMGCILSEVD
jgi:hypothetical protein